MATCTSSRKIKLLPRASNARPQNSACRPDAMTIVNRVGMENNPYAGAYRNMHTIQQVEEIRATAEGREPHEVI